MSTPESFTNDQIKIALSNTFILLGNTGNGKSTITNLLCKSNAKVSQSKQSVTNEAKSYYGKIDDANYINVVDTPGFNDNGGEEKDKNNYELIKDYLVDTKSFIKGIYIVCDFQSVRFGKSEQICVKAISEIFPLKNFWNYVTIVFTHYFDKGCDSRLKIKKSKVFQDSLKQSLEQLIQDISKDNEDIDKISYDKIKILYADIYDDVEKVIEDSKNLDDEEREELEEMIKKKKSENERSYKELIKDIKDKMNNTPLYDEVKIDKNVKVILYEENHSTILASYNLYDAEIERRCFFFNKKLLSIDIKLNYEPIFRENVNKFLHDATNIIKPILFGATIGYLGVITIPYFYFKSGEEKNTSVLHQVALGFSKIYKFISPEEHEKEKMKKKLFH